MWDTPGIFLILPSLQYTKVNGATVFSASRPWRYYWPGGGWGGMMLRCPRPIVSLGIKSDLKTSTGHNCYRKWVAPSVQWLGKRRIGIRLLATTQCSSSPPSSNRLWDPHNTYPNDTEGSFLGYYNWVLTLAAHLHLAPKVNYNQVWNYTSIKNGNARSGLYC